MPVVTEAIPVKFKTMILKKVSANDVPQMTDFGQLSVLFMDEDTNTLKIAVPTYNGVKPIDENNISQLDALQKAPYRSSFINITDKITDKWDNIEDDMFAVVINAETRKVMQMTQLTDFNADCIDYFYQHLDPKDCKYPLDSKRKNYVLYQPAE